METATAQTFDLVVLDDEGNWKVIVSKLTYEDADNKLERWIDVYPNAIADIIETGKHQAKKLTLCIFDPKPVTAHSTGVYTSLVPSSDDPTVMVCSYEGHTLEALRAQGKVSQEAFQCSWEEAGGYARDLARQRLCKGPQRVTRERWWELLEVLFPARWEQQVGNSDHEIFMVPECITSTLYTFGVRIGEEYFTITEDYDIPASKLIEACMELK